MEVREFTLEESHRPDLEELLFQLSGKKRSVRLDNLSQVHCVGVFDGERLVGFAQLFILPKTTFTIGHLEDVVIHAEYREKGLGKKIMEEAVRIAVKHQCAVINLTTRPEREVARALYESMGFIDPGNQVLRLNLPVDEKE